MPSPDRMGPKRIVRYISYRDSGAIVGSGSAVDASTGVGDMIEAEIGALDMVALIITAGDKHSWFFPIPRDMNVTGTFGVRIRFSSASTTAADTHTWLTLYDVIAEDAAIAVATTVMDTTHVAADDTDSGVANAWQMSTRAELNGDTFTEAQIIARALLAINVELDATDAGETIHLHGIEYDYVPKRYIGAPHSWNPDVDLEGK